jgi:nicotinate-nucleotide adenylyltransferase
MNRAMPPPRYQRFASASGLRIGVLGGSFNPAHAGHVHISLEAMKRLKLDAVWWIVSPANPLKDPATLAPFAVRYRHAVYLVVRHPRILVCDIEQRHHLRYTIDTLALLKIRFPRHHFVWLMGSDNMATFHHWHHWERIAASLPIAVMDRAPTTHRALRSRFALRFAARRRSSTHLASARPPAWESIFIRRHPLSATFIRKTLGEKAFLVHNDKSLMKYKESVLSTPRVI